MFHSPLQILPKTIFAMIYTHTHSNTLLLISKTDLNKKRYDSTIFQEILPYQKFMKLLI